MFWSDDPVADYDRYSRQQEDWLDNLPKCEYCGEAIQDEEYFEIEGYTVHEECLRDFCSENYKKTNNYL